MQTVTESWRSAALSQSGSSEELPGPTSRHRRGTGLHAVSPRRPRHAFRNAALDLGLGTDRAQVRPQGC